LTESDNKYNQAKRKIEGIENEFKAEFEVLEMNHKMCEFENEELTEQLQAEKDKFKEKVRKIQQEFKNRELNLAEDLEIVNDQIQDLQFESKILKERLTHFEQTNSLLTASLLKSKLDLASKDKELESLQSDLTIILSEKQANISIEMLFTEINKLTKELLQQLEKQPPEIQYFRDFISNISTQLLHLQSFLSQIPQSSDLTPIFFPKPTSLASDLSSDTAEISPTSSDLNF
jgi:chromosome segregation ATPase